MSLQEFLQEPAGKITAISAGVGMVSAGIAHVIQHVRAEVFPSLPSRIDTKPELAENEVAQYYAACNDLVMHLTGAWNNARKYNKYEIMLNELRYDLTRTIEKVQEIGPKLRAEAQELLPIAQKAARVAKLFDDAWNYDYTNHYKTKIYTARVNGKRVVRTKQVYTHTTHRWDYYHDKGRAAVSELNELMAEDPQSRMPRHDFKAMRVEPDHVDIERIQRTIHEEEGAQVSEEQAADLLNTWNDDAALNDIPVLVTSRLDYLGSSDARQKNSAMLNSRSTYREKTYTRGSTTGPAGYESSKVMHATSLSVWEQLTKLEESFAYSVGLGDEIAQQVHAPKYDKARKRAHSLMDSAVALYKASFPDSEMDIDQRSKGWITAVVGFGAALTTGAIMGVMHAMDGY